jgi:hypothetical protein
MTTTPDFRALLADNAYAASFQSMGQYRTALLKALATPPPEPTTELPPLLAAALKLREENDLSRLFLPKPTPPPEPPKTKPNLTPILASILLGRHEPLEWHHAAFLSAYFGYPSKDELRNIALTGVYSTPTPEPPTDEERLADFAQWLAREMPRNTVIGDPLWWAPRIARAVLERWGHGK